MVYNLKDILIEHGISPSYHRLKIYEFLMNNKAHPTADMIYTSIIKLIPTLSKTTIYNTLKTLIEKGLVSSITIEENEVRYDADISFHGHFKCSLCGSLYDLDCGFLNINKKLNITKKIQGHTISDMQLYFRGICKKCQK